MTFFNLDLLVTRQFVENCAKTVPKRAVDHLLTAFGNEHNVIFAVPCRARQTFVLSYGRISSVVEGTVENSSDRSNGQTHESPPA